MIAWGRVGVPIRIEAHYTKNGVGVDGLTVTADYHDESLNWTTGVGLAPAGGSGHYYVEITPDAAGQWAGHTVTAGDVDQKHQGFIINVEAADATVAGIATAVWAAGTRTLTGFGTLASDVATAVWAAGTRTLTSLGSAVADIVAAVLAGLTVPIAQVAAIYARVLTPGSIQVVSPGPDLFGVITVIPGDAYGLDHGNEINVPIPSAPDVSTASLAFTVDGITFSPAVVPVVSGVGDDRIATLELSSAQSALLSALIPGGWIKGRRVYWRIVATWVETPAKPQTIAVGEIRRPAWETRA